MHGLSTLHRLNNQATGPQQYPAITFSTPDEVLDQAREILQYRLTRPETTTFSSPDAVKSFLQLKLASAEREIFACLFLDNRHRLISYEELFFGTIDGASVHPREVVKSALGCNAAAVILAHNHPSGVAEPSRADEAITTRLKDALGLIDVRVLDHLIVGSDAPVSFAERGLI